MAKSKAAKVAGEIKNRLGDTAKKRSEAAKKAAATRKQNARDRSAAAKKGVATRKRRG